VCSANSLNCPAGPSDVYFSQSNYFCRPQPRFIPLGLSPLTLDLCLCKVVYERLSAHASVLVVTYGVQQTLGFKGKSVASRCDQILVWHWCSARTREGDVPLTWSSLHQASFLYVLRVAQLSECRYDYGHESASPIAAAASIDAITVARP